MKFKIASVLSALMFVGACSQEPEQANIDTSTQSGPGSAQEPAPLWLEEVEGEQALAQVTQWNTKTLDKLMADERFDQFQQVNEMGATAASH